MKTHVVGYLGETWWVGVVGIADVTLRLNYETW